MRRHWFKKHLNQFVGTTGNSKKSQTTRYTCPCCGFPTLHVRNLYDCCTVCFWEDNGQDDQDAEAVLGGPNGDYSLTDARKNFVNYLSMFSPKDEYDFSIHSGKLARKAKQDLLDYYERIKENPTRYSQQEIFDYLENQVETIRQIISREFRKAKESLLKPLSDKKMNRTDEEELLWAADLIRTWEWKYEVAEIHYTFTVLDRLPLDKYPEAWAELREAFRNNEDLNHPTVKKNLSVPANAEEGRWWWDPELW